MVSINTNNSAAIGVNNLNKTNSSLSNKQAPKTAALFLPLRRPRVAIQRLYPLLNKV
jgi:hypothetical protein